MRNSRVSLQTFGQMSNNSNNKHNKNKDLEPTSVLIINYVLMRNNQVNSTDI